MVTLRKPDPLRLLGKRLILIALALLVASMAWGVWSIYRKNAEAQRLRNESDAQLADLNAREATLQGDIGELKTGRGVEAVLRNNYGVGQAGENMIVIVEPQAPAASTTPSGWDWVHRFFFW